MHRRLISVGYARKLLGTDNGPKKEKLNNKKKEENTLSGLQSLLRFTSKDNGVLRQRDKESLQ